VILGGALSFSEPVTVTTRHDTALDDELEHSDVLVVGAHPDDIEIGSFALLNRLAERGARLVYLILSDDATAGAERRVEALAAAKRLGVSTVYFAAMRDGFIRADAQSVQCVRDILQRADVTPKLVVVHSEADSHNDHVEACRIMHAAVRGAVFLHYAIHISAETTQFTPDIWIEMTPPTAARKELALRDFRSQEHRIRKHDLGSFHAKLGQQVHIRPAEAFELHAQEGAERWTQDILELSDHRFIRFWRSLEVRTNLDLYYSSETSSDSVDPHAELLESQGRDQLREAFAQHWWGKSPVHEFDAATALSHRYLETRGTRLVMGGPISNPVTRQIYAHASSLTWRVAYDMPRSGYARIVASDDARREFVTTDRRAYVHLYVLRLPSGSVIIGVSGTVVQATKAAMQLFADPERIALVEPLARAQNRAEMILALGDWNEAETGQLEVTDAELA
jgi:LmbE family N-acetylglucosaminyl deacetylase